MKTSKTSFVSHNEPSRLACMYRNTNFTLLSRKTSFRVEREVSAFLNKAAALINPRLFSIGIRRVLALHSLLVKWIRHERRILISSVLLLSRSRSRPNQKLTVHKSIILSLRLHSSSLFRCLNAVWIPPHTPGNGITCKVPQYRTRSLLLPQTWSLERASFATLSSSRVSLYILHSFEELESPIKRLRLPLCVFLVNSD